MSYQFLEHFNVNKPQFPETLEMYVLRQLKQQTKENDLLQTGRIYYQNFQFQGLNNLLIVIPQNYVSPYYKKMYINSVKTYRSLENEGIINTFLKQYFGNTLNIYKINDNDITLEEYIGQVKLSQQMILRLSQQLLSAIQKCHDNIYYIEYLNMQTIFIDKTTHQVKLINPIQKLAYQEQLEITQNGQFIKQNSQTNLQKKRSFQMNSNSNIQTQVSDTLPSPKNSSRPIEYFKIGKMLEKDDQAFIDTILNIARIKQKTFEQMLKFNVLYSFFQNNYSGVITKSMQYFLIYIWKVKQDGLQFKLSDIEKMIANILHQGIRNNQMRQLSQSQLNKNKINQTNQTFSENQYNKCMINHTVWLDRISDKIKNHEESYYYLRSLQRNKQKSIQDWKLLAWILFKFNKFFVEPIKILEQKVLKNQSEDDESYSMIGMIYYKWKKYKQAISSFKNALKFNICNQNALYYLGKYYCKIEKNFEKGISYYQQLIQINPFNGILIRKICKSLMSQTNVPLSTVTFWQFLSLVIQPNNVKILLMLAKKYYEMNNTKLAKFFCCKGIDITKKEKEFYFILAQIFNKKLDFNKCLKYYIKADKLNHKQAPAFLFNQYKKRRDLEDMEIQFIKKINYQKQTSNQDINDTELLYSSI